MLDLPVRYDGAARQYQGAAVLLPEAAKTNISDEHEHEQHCSAVFGERTRV